MDYQKDNKFHQQASGTNTQGHQPKSQQQGDISFLVRKIEKLTTALYMVTDIMSDKEPMKWKSRETGVELLSDIAVSSGSAAGERMTALRNVMKKIERVVSYLDIAQGTRMISEMNASVLKREYLALKDTIDAEWKRVYDDSKSIFSDSFFEVAQTATRTLGSGRVEGTETEKHVVHHDVHQQAPVQRETLKPVVQTPIEPRMTFSSNQSENTDLRSALRALTAEKESFKGHPMVQSRVEGVREVAPQERRPEEAAPRVTPLPPLTPRVGSAPIEPKPMARVTVSESGIIERARPDVGRDDRRKIILALIKQKPSLTVKDIAKSIPGVSEKTIQRELLAMVVESILVKRGERRWSTYSLKD